MSSLTFGTNLPTPNSLRLIVVVASKPTAGYDARWGHGAVSADTFVQMVYESLTADGASR